MEIDAVVLTLVFAAALGIAACAAAAFAGPIDEVLARVLPSELARAWSRFVRFAVFTASFIGGLRLRELGSFIASGVATGGLAPLDAGACLLEVYKTVAGALGAAAWGLFVFFLGSLAAYGALKVYGSFKQEHVPARAPDRHALPAVRT